MAEIPNNETVSGKEIVIENAIDNGSYELGVINRLNDIAKLTEQRASDYEMLSGYVLGNNDVDAMSFSVTQTFKDVITQLEQIKQQMKSELNWESFVGALSSTALDSFEQGRAGAMDKLLAMLDPLTAAVVTLQDNVLSKMGIPNIPVIGNIQQILVKLGEIGRVVSRLSAEDRENARKAAKEEEEKAGGSALYRLYHDSIVEKTVNEIIDLFWQALDLLQKIIALIEPFLLMMLLEKLKPVIETFSLSLGEIYGMAESAYEVGKMVIFNQAKLLDLFAEAIRSKVEDLWNVVRYFIHGGVLPNDAMISAVAKDIVCCDFDISANNLDVDLIRLNQELYSQKTMLEKLQKMEEKEEPLSESQRSAINTTIPKQIKQLETKKIPKAGKAIQQFNKTREKKFQMQYTKLVAENLAKKIEIEKASTSSNAAQ